MDTRLQVLIVDDQSRARHGLRALLSTLPQVGGVYEAENGRQAIDFVVKAPPDIVLMDVRMPEMDGLTATHHIKTHWPRVKVVVLSMYADYEVDAMSQGADAFVCKGDPPAKLLGALAALLPES